jgi:O-antigen ligase
MAATITALPLVAVFFPLFLAPVLVVAAALTVFYFRRFERAWPIPPTPLLAIIGLLIAWSLLSVLWSIEPETTFTKVWRGIGSLAAGLVVVAGALRLSNHEAARLSRCLLIGLIAAVLVLLFMRSVFVSAGTLFPTDGPTQDKLIPYNRGMTVIAVFVWAAALYASRFGAWAPAALVAVAGALLSIYASTAALLAVAAGAVVALLVRAHRMVAPAIAGLLAIFVLVIPLLPAALPPPAEMRAEYHVPGSGYHRLLIWQFTAERIAERPILGWGYNVSRVVPGHDSRPDGVEAALPHHPHSFAFQLWLELGVVGAAIAAALILYIGWRIGRAAPPTAAAAAGCLMSATTVCLLSYGAWQSWWLAALSLAAAFMTLAGNAEAARDR